MDEECDPAASASASASAPKKKRDGRARAMVTYASRVAIGAFVGLYCLGVMNKERDDVGRERNESEGERRERASAPEARVVMPTHARVAYVAQAPKPGRK